MQTAGRAGHAAGDVGGEAGRAFVGREHEFDSALAHRLHQRKHIAARNPEAAGDAVGPERCDDQIGVVHAMDISIWVGAWRRIIQPVFGSDCCRAENRRSRIKATAAGRGPGGSIAGLDYTRRKGMSSADFRSPAGERNMGVG